MVVFLQSLLFLFMVLLSLFLILIILLQRGKGGGLVGAFGGMGGNSAFGAKTSDVFMRITVVAAIIWFVSCIGGRYILDMKSASLVDEIAGSGTAAAVAPVEPTTGESAPSDAPATNAAPAPAENPAPTSAPVSDAPASDAPVGK